MSSIDTETDASAPPETATAVQAPTRANYKATFAVIAVGITAFSLLQSLVSPVLPTLQHDLHTTQNTVTWVLTAYLLSASICTPILGRLGDMYGKERVFVAALVALAVGTFLAAIATNIQIMIVGRVIQGAGGGVLALSFGIVRDEFPQAKVAGAVGVIASLAAVGAGLGVVLAGPIVEVLDYHWLFWIPMVFVIAAAIAAHFFVPESPVRTPGRISWTPALLLSAWLVALLVAVSEAPVWGWGSPRIIGLIVGAVVVLFLWIASEQRARTPLIDMQMMRLRAVWTNNVVAFLLGMAMYSQFVFVPEFVQTPSSAGYGFGASITASGLILLPSTIGMFFVGLYAGRIAHRVGGKMVVIVGCLISAAAMVMFAFANGAQWELYIASAIMGAGFGLAYSAMSGLIVAAVPSAQTGVASGMNANIRTIGGSIGAAVMASIVTSQIGLHGYPKQIGYTIGFTALAVALVGAALAAAFIPTLRTTPVIDPEDEPEHAQLALLAAGTIVGDKPE